MGNLVGWLHRDPPRLIVVASAAAVELVGPAWVLGDRFVGWGQYNCIGAGRVGQLGESWRSHGEGTQVLRLWLGPGFGLSLSFSLEKSFAALGLAVPLPAVWRGCQVGGEEGCQPKHQLLGEGFSYQALSA